LGEHELSLYLRGVGVKYCDKPIVIGCIGDLLEYTLFSNSRSLLGNDGLLEMLFPLPYFG